MNETLDLRGRGPDARKQRARDLPSRESIQLTLRVLRTLKVPHQIRHRQAQRHQRDQRVVQFERRDGADEQRGPRDGASVQRRPEESLLVRAHARHALVVPRLEPPPRLPGVVYLVPIPQTDEQASADVLAPPKIDREREDARHEICDETVRIDEFARQVRRDRRHLQRQRHRRRRGVRLDVGRDGHRGHAARRGAKCRRTRVRQRSNASRPKRHTRSLDAPRRGTDASGETRARTTRARRATRADAKEGRARARGDGVEWLDRRIGSARRVGTRSTRRHPIDRGRDRRDAEDEARCIGGGARARGGAGGPRADDVATDRHQGDGASRRGQGGARHEQDVEAKVGDARSECGWKKETS